MPELRWSEHDFIECLAVLPVQREQGAVYEFTVSRDGLRLRLTVWPYESVVGVELGADGVSAFAIRLALFVRGGITLRECPGQEWLEFADCVIAPSRFSYLDLGSPHDRSCYPHGQTIRIAASPHISVELLRE